MNFFMYELLPSILNMSLISSYVIILVLVARLLLKKAPKIFSYVLWAVVLVRLLCPFSFESAIGLLPSNTEPIPQDIVHTEYPSVDLPFEVINEAINENLPQGEEQLVADPLEAPVAIGTLIWGLGIAVMVAYSIISLIKLRRKLIGATPLEKNIYIADHIDSPFVMGFIRPKIYLPSNLTDAECAFIISHEQTHIKRLDHITRILAFTSLAVHWFNPLVWIAFVLSSKDMETSCDESVMKKMNTDIRADYSEALLKFATGKKLIAATPLAFGEGDTKGRVKNVMKYKKPVVWVSAICLILVSVVAVSLMSNSKNDQSLKIENYTWEMTTIQSYENNGQIIAYGKNHDNISDTASSVLLSCEAENGELIMTDSSNYKVYLGTYTENESDSESIIYDVEIEGMSGMAVCSLTTYSDDSEKPTLIISLDDYALNFFSTDKLDEEKGGWKEESIASSISFGDDNEFEFTLYEENTSTGINTTLNKGDRVKISIWSESEAEIQVGLIPLDENEFAIYEEFVGETVSLTKEPQEITVQVPKDGMYRVSFSNTGKNEVSASGKVEYETNGKPVDFESIEIGTAKETIREKFGEPDTFGNWNYDEIYLLTDAQITISYDSDSETNSFVEEVNINTHARLSLNDIIMLSSKGEDLTWADFEEFPYIEGGSGVYIRAYDINDLFRFSIGGGLTDDEPMYMTLRAKIENEPSIDIRTENVTEFISKYGVNTSDNNAPLYDLIPMVMVNDKMYIDTGKMSEDTMFENPESSNFDGWITSTVDGSERPTKNNESNFGEGFGYKIIDEESVAIYINEEWYEYKLGDGYSVADDEQNAVEIVGDPRLLTEEELAFFNDNYFDIMYEKEGYPIRFSEGTRMGDEVQLIYRGYDPETGDIYEMIEHIVTIQQEGEDYTYISHEPVV